MSKSSSKAGGRADGPTGSTAAAVLDLNVGGMDCAACAAAVEKAVCPLPGVRQVQVDVVKGRVRVEREGSRGQSDIARAIRGAGYTVEVDAKPAAPAIAPRVWSAAISGLLLGLGMLAGNSRLAIPVLFLSALVGSIYVVPRAIRALRVGSLDINILVTLASIGAMILGEWSEAAAVMFLFAIAQLLETWAMGRARRAIQALMQLAPSEATVLRDGQLAKVPVGSVKVGETVLVRPGERLPLDGVITAGESVVDQATITGESVPVTKDSGGEVFAGTINGHGALEVRVTHHAEDTTLARIMHAVEEAQSTRAPTQSLVDRFAKVYTPAVVGLAALIAVIPPLAMGGEWATWLYRALALLVIACPCALVISTPVTIVSGLTGAARAGVLIKGGAQLEAAGRLSTIAFDKTGTLTLGRLQLTDVIPLNGLGSRELIGLAAGVDRHSEHPVARAVVHAAVRDGITPVESTAFTALPGRGARAIVAGKPIFIGNMRICSDLGTCRDEVHRTIEALEAQGKTAILLSDEAEPLGVLAIADEPRPKARENLDAIRASGVRRIVMLTGDNLAVARRVGSELGVDDVRAGLLPADKQVAVAGLREQGERVGVVGDGVNDAPALAAADIGIAMGAAGSHVALETADIVLMSDDLGQVAQTIARSRRTVRIVKENITFALAIKVVFLGLALAGMATLWMAVAADMGASLAVILNGLRALHHPQNQA
ncbi:MAG TPA: heavy metal translocating P-type ATPase [Gemmatimonadales bacterium]|nr:heavy metal translocating P-type ATPase [Gemmatimonadales bacterium]